MGITVCLQTELKNTLTKVKRLRVFDGHRAQAVLMPRVSWGKHTLSLYICGFHGMDQYVRDSCVIWKKRCALWMIAFIS